ncbi:hypothetical protein RND81_12G104400 [Saponaria officinalis]|uniref:Uncharacterized protein n=1 Tax=Saponaria officinalis TaxID=3572 RepID=A0AAW1H8W6_SAPOF
MFQKNLRRRASLRRRRRPRPRPRPRPSPRRRASLLLSTHTVVDSTKTKTQKKNVYIIFIAVTVNSPPPSPSQSPLSPCFSPFLLAVVLHFSPPFFLDVVLSSPTTRRGSALSPWSPSPTVRRGPAIAPWSPSLTTRTSSLLQAAFVILDCYKDYCLSRAEESLRQWKVNVSRYQLYVDKNTCEMKSHPPKAYPNITQAHWDSFKEYRGSEKFKALNKKNRENIAKKESIFYGSRGGYRLVKETLRALGASGNHVVHEKDLLDGFLSWAFVKKKSVK